VAELVVLNRFRVPEDVERFRVEAQGALDALAARPGFVDGALARNLDDSGLWVLTTTWENVGSYRRALSAYDVKVSAVPLLSLAVDEPSAYELLAPTDVPNDPQARELD
jgi:quinol monooxygenase YgiN